MYASRLAVLALLVTGCSEYDFTAATDAPTPPGAETDTNDPSGEGEPGVAKGAIEGRICSPSEATYVAGATVAVELADGTLLTTLTDTDGFFLLENVPAGDHLVLVEKGSFSTSFEVQVEEGLTTQLAEEECLSAEEIEVAVVSGMYDSIQIVLDHLGVPYTLINGTNGTQHVNLLRNPSEMEKYDIIFFNCGMSDAWVSHQSEIAQNVQDYVSNGGSVYVSDWSYFLAEVSFPDMIDYVGDDTRAGAAYVGIDGIVNATVRDSGMITALGSDTAQLNYDLPSWAAPAKVGTGKALINGNYKYYEGWSQKTEEGPLAARLETGAGQILYTSFHNEQQKTLDMDILLQEIIFSL